MHLLHRQLPGLAAVGLVGVAVLSAWLIQREAQIPAPDDLWEASAGKGNTDLDRIRQRLYEVRERYRQTASLSPSSRRRNQAATLQGLQAWIEDCASRLGQTLRPDPEIEPQPEAFFVSYAQGIGRMRLLEWVIKGASAAYTFEIAYPGSDMPNEIVRDVRERDLVGDVRLLASSSPTRVGKTYKKVIRVSSRGKEKTRTVKLPDFRILQLTFQHVSGGAETLVLEDAYSELDRSKARESGISFERGIEWDIPLATLALRDGETGETRSITTKKGTKFVFANAEYVVLDIRPDSMEVSPAGSVGKVETWTRREHPPAPL